MTAAAAPEEGLEVGRVTKGRMFSKTTTDSGLRILTERMPAAQSVTVGIWICSSVVEEPEERLGISHFAEHMLFKGTWTRTAADIAETIDSIGGYLDAFTDREHVCFYAKVLSDRAPVALDLLGDMISHPRLKPSDIAIEKSVVFEEILSCEDTPEDLVVDRFTETIWQDSPLGRNILGSTETVGHLDRGLLREFMVQYYSPDNILVSAAGNLQHEDITRWAESSLGDLEGRRPAPCANGRPTIRPNHTLIDKDLEQVYLCVGAPSYGQDSPRKIAVHLLDSILSGGCSSRLFQKIREKRGLVYSIGSSSACYLDAGFLAVTASCSVEHAEEVVDLISRELRLLKRKGITAKELDRAIQQAKGNLLLATESSGERMIRNAQNEIYFARRIPIKEVLAAVDGVTVEDVNAVAREILRDSAMNFLAVGPFEKHKLNVNVSVG